MPNCNLCPRRCNADRSSGEKGFCLQGDSIRVARIAPHFFEEPPISGMRGSGTVFFVGCSLRCIFCQNKDISRSSEAGRPMSHTQFCDALLALQNRGVHNINLVTPTHYIDKIAPALKELRESGRLTVPVLYNSSGYESVEALQSLDGLIDIYMPDFKYFSSELSKSYSSASDYAEKATLALKEMYRQVGKYKYSKNEPEILESGLLVRHLVLPACRADSIAVFEHLSTFLDPDDILVSIMSQYTPEFALDTPHKNLRRRVTSFEYNTVVDRATSLGFNGFMQAKASSSASYTPDFDTEQ